MAATYEPIATTTVSTATTQIDFNSISGSYTDIVAVISGTVATTVNPYIRFNSDSGSNYSATWVAGSGSAASSSRQSNVTNILIGAFGTAVSTLSVHIMNYANTTTNKTIVSRSSTTSTTNQAVSAWVGLWRDSDAITDISFIVPATREWQSGTTFTLYGIAAA